MIGCEPELADDARRSFLSKKLEPVLRSDTIADGLRTSLGELTLAAILNYADDIITVSERSIIQNMRDIWERMNLIAEPSSDRKSTRLNSSHVAISYAVFCLKKKKKSN